MGYITYKYYIYIYIICTYINTFFFCSIRPLIRFEMDYVRALLCPHEFVSTEWNDSRTVLCRSPLPRLHLPHYFPPFFGCDRIQCNARDICRTLKERRDESTEKKSLFIINVYVRLDVRNIVRLRTRNFCLLTTVDVTLVSTYNSAAHLFVPVHTTAIMLLKYTTAY